MTAFLSDDTFTRLVEALAAVEPEPITGDRSAQVSEALCMVANVWPESMRGELQANDNARAA